MCGPAQPNLFSIFVDVDIEVRLGNNKYSKNSHENSGYLQCWQLIVGLETNSNSEGLNKSKHSKLFYVQLLKVPSGFGKWKTIDFIEFLFQATTVFLKSRSQSICRSLSELSSCFGDI